MSLRSTVYFAGFGGDSLGGKRLRVSNSRSRPTTTPNASISTRWTSRPPTTSRRVMWRRSTWRNCPTANCSGPRRRARPGPTPRARNGISTRVEPLDQRNRGDRLRDPGDRAELRACGPPRRPDRPAVTGPALRRLLAQEPRASPGLGQMAAPESLVPRVRHRRGRGADLEEGRDRHGPLRAAPRPVRVPLPQQNVPVRDRGADHRRNRGCRPGHSVTGRHSASRSTTSRQARCACCGW